MVTEGSAGSTAISLATVAPAYGCRCHVVIPDDAAIEKVHSVYVYTFHEFLFLLLDFLLGLYFCMII
jgi:threonine synthase